MLVIFGSGLSLALAGESAKCPCSRPLLGDESKKRIHGPMAGTPARSKAKGQTRFPLRETCLVSTISLLEHSGLVHSSIGYLEVLGFKEVASSRSYSASWKPQRPLGHLSTGLANEVSELHFLTMPWLLPCPFVPLFT